MIPRGSQHSWESGNLNSELNSETWIQRPKLAVNSLCSGNITDTLWAFLIVFIILITIKMPVIFRVYSYLQVFTGILDLIQVSQRTRVSSSVEFEAPDVYVISPRSGSWLAEPV